METSQTQPRRPKRNRLRRPAPPSPFVLTVTADGCGGDAQRDYCFRAGTASAGTQARSAQLWSPQSNRQSGTPSVAAIRGKNRLSTALPDSSC